MILNITQDKMREMTLEWIVKYEGLIVELGCSDGNFAKLLFENNIKNYCGIDILEEKIKKAKIKFPGMDFICCDIINNLSILHKAKTFVSFQCLEHIKEDLKILNSLKCGTNIIISVPNSNYKGHIRWFEIDGWKNRFSQNVDFNDSYTIQHPIKRNKRSFLFKGNKK